MKVTVAINLYNGRCINTIHPDYSTVHDCDPISIAKKWNNIGANWIHVTDINGTKEENPINLELIKDIISKVNAPIQVAAGINNLKSFEDILISGAGRVVLDTRVITNTDFLMKVLKEYPENVVILLNIDSGSVETDDNYHENAANLLNNLRKHGLKRFIYHDISKNT